MTDVVEQTRTGVETRGTGWKQIAASNGPDPCYGKFLLILARAGSTNQVYDTVEIEWWVGDPMGTLVGSFLRTTATWARQDTVSGHLATQVRLVHDSAMGVVGIEVYLAYDTSVTYTFAWDADDQAPGTTIGWSSNPTPGTTTVIVTHPLNDETVISRNGLIATASASEAQFIGGTLSTAYTSVAQIPATEYSYGKFWLYGVHRDDHDVTGVLVEWWNGNPAELDTGPIGWWFRTTPSTFGARKIDNVRMTMDPTTNTIDIEFNGSSARGSWYLEYDPASQDVSVDYVAAAANAANTLILATHAVYDNTTRTTRNGRQGEPAHQISGYYSSTARWVQVAEMIPSRPEAGRFWIQGVHDAGNRAHVVEVEWQIGSIYGDALRATYLHTESSRHTNYVFGNVRLTLNATTDRAYVEVYVAATDNGAFHLGWNPADLSPTVEMMWAAVDSAAVLVGVAHNVSVNGSVTSRNGTLDPVVDTLNELTDVDTATTAPVANDVLKFNGTAWVPSAVAAGVDSLDDLTDVDTTTAAPTTGQVLMFNGTLWAPANLPSTSHTHSINDMSDVDTSGGANDNEQLTWSPFGENQWVPYRMATAATADDLMIFDGTTWQPLSLADLKARLDALETP